MRGAIAESTSALSGEDSGIGVVLLVDAALRHALVYQLGPLLALAATHNLVDPWGQQIDPRRHPAVAGQPNVKGLVHHDDDLQIRTTCPGAGGTVVAILPSKSREIGRLTNAGFSLVDRGRCMNTPMLVQSRKVVAKLPGAGRLAADGFFILLCVLPTLCIPVTRTEAQQHAQTPRVGFLWIGSASPPSPLVTSFQQGLRDLGWIDGQNVIVEYRYAEGKPERFDAFAAELAQTPVDVIVAGPAPAIYAAKKATSTVPIVITLGADPVALKLVESLDRPGGNVTGLDEITPQLTSQRLSLLKKIVPGLVRVAILRQSGTLRDEALQQMESAVNGTAQKLKVSVEFVEAKAADDLEAAFETIAQQRADGLIVLVSPMLNTEAKRITGLATKRRLPAIYEWRTFVAAGGAISYGADLSDICRRAAAYVDKILKGATAASLLVEHPTKLELVIDLNHAKDIGMVIPESVLQRADQVLR